LNDGTAARTFKVLPIDERSPMEEKPALVVRGDVPGNRIEVRYQGRVTAADVQSVYRKVMDLLPLMRSGFTFLADLSGLESMDLDCAPFITKIMDACNAAAIGTVVRIVPDSRKDIGLNILSIIHYRRGVHVLTCENSAEADRVL
jgi:hypothetical protein